jgi:hypothetical protein
MRLGLGIALNRGAFVGGLDPDAKAYIAAVENEDGQALESGVREAYNNFIKGCKSDGIWSAIKASCILAGARTLDGALVPLVGTAPTNNNFVSGDYNRETGLIGNGSTKYLDSNRNNNADPQDDKHLVAWKTTNPTISNGGLIGNNTNTSGTSWLFDASSGASIDTIRLNQASSVTGLLFALTGFVGASRSNSSNINIRTSGTTTNYSAVSTTRLSETIDVFRSAGGQYSPARLSFYSIGESLDLALLDTRVGTLMTDLAAAIP